MGPPQVLLRHRPIPLVLLEGAMVTKSYLFLQEGHRLRAVLASNISHVEARADAHNIWDQRYVLRSRRVVEA